MLKESWLQNFTQTYSGLGVDNIDSLELIYHKDVEFRDPIHQVIGIEALLRYFEQSYLNINHCDFVIEKVLDSGTEAAVYWSMNFSHKKLNHQKIIHVEGHSHLKEKDGLVIYHRDYLDVGEMIYEHIPVIGSLIQRIKQRVGQ